MFIDRDRFDAYVQIISNQIRPGKSDYYQCKQFLIIAISAKCVSSILKTLVFNALKALWKALHKFFYAE
jgi:hypothetical protein